MLVRLGIAEKDEHDVPQIPSNEPVIATDGLRDIAPKFAGRLAQILEAEAVGSRRQVNQLAGHGGDLPPLHATIGPWRGFRRYRYRRRSDDAVLRFRDHRSNKPVAAPRQRFYPPLTARSGAEHPAQRRDLNRQVAFLNCPAGPGSFDQRVLRNHCAGLF
jgi:hypothetical protein